MCGIIGYVGKHDSKEVILSGLEQLEYRGYDSAGVAVLNEKGVHIFKEKGNLSFLKDAIDSSVEGNIGIGHTRWATHGPANQINAHPHQSQSGKFTLVHNGVIDNYQELKEQYLPNYSFKSDTDSEVIVQLIEKFHMEGFSTEESFRKTLTLLEGSYAIVLLDREDAETLYASRNKSPLIVGLGEGFNIIESDVRALYKLTKKVKQLMDKEMITVTRESATIKDFKGNIIQREPFIADIDESDIDKGIYEHYMMKEIDEQPFVIRKIIEKYQDEKGNIVIENAIREAIIQSDRIYIVACGTSYHAGLIGKQLLEKIAKIPVEVHIASEFAYNTPLLSEKPFFVYISQSGETADLRAVLVKVKDMGFPALTITNVKGSTLSREVEHTLLIHAGYEVAVASTKAYTAQIAVLSLLATDLAIQKEISLSFNMVKELSLVANAMEVLCQGKESMEQIAKEFLSEPIRNAFFIGRSTDYNVCLEAALKLKEISYIQAEGFAGGELKHGTIALIEEGTPVFALSTQSELNLNIRGNVQEVNARGAKTCVISMSGLEQKGDTLILPKVHPYLTSLISVIPLQLISYYAALHRGCNVDKPRNLAKSVTVE